MTFTLGSRLLPVDFQSVGTRICGASLLAVLMTSISMSAEQPWSVMQIPKNCHTQAFRDESFMAFDALRFKQRVTHETTRHIWKYDVVCIGDDLKVDTNIFSNGGNVYIFGDRVRIDAQIDTRVFRPYRLDEFFLPQPQSKKTYDKEYWPIAPWRSNTNVYALLSRSDAAFGTPQYLAAYTEHYRCVACRTTGGGTQLIPRMPDGATPPFSGYYKKKAWNGIAPPIDELNRETFKSGSVVIVARHLEMAPEPASPRVVVHGLPGGIGGLGPPDYCTGAKSAGAYSSCPSDGPRGLSAAGGPGGDAGSIFIVTAETAPSVPNSMLYDYAGGKAASTVILRSPPKDSRKIPASLTGTMNDFEIVRTEPPATDGASGKLSLTSADRDELLPIFLDVLTVGMAFRPYSVQEIASRALEDDTVKFKSFDDYIASVVDDLLRRRLAFYASSLAPLARSDSALEKLPGGAAFCSQDSSDQVLRADVRVLLSTYRTTCAGDGSPKDVKAYFLGTGGAMHRPSPNVGTDVKLDLLQVGSALNNQALQEIKLQLNTLNLGSLDILKQVGQTNYTAQIGRLEGAIAATKAAVDKAPSDLEMAVQLVGAVYTGGASLVVTYENMQTWSESKKNPDGTKGEYTWKERAEQGKAFQKSSGDVRDAYNEARTALSARQELAENQRKLDALSAQLAAVQRELRDFSSDVQNRRSEIETEKLEFANDLFDSRSNVEAVRRGLVVGVPDILKILLTDYVLDPARDVESLKRNSDALAIYVRDPVAGGTLLQVKSPTVTCRESREVSVGSWVRQDEDCIAVASQDQRVTVWGTIRLKNGGLTELPLYHIALGPAKFTLPLYGISRYRVVND